MRQFTAFEQLNMKYLVNQGIKFTLVEVTPTGLKKSILDSTAPMRAFFLEEGIHDYASQQQGPEHKATYPTVILTETGRIETQSSFYRPVTKKGDPRMWIYKLTAHTEGNDIYVLFHIDGTLYAVNLTKVDIEKCCNSPIITPLREVVGEIRSRTNSVSDELLGKFRSVSGKWFESEVNADTGIGRSIESFLGISMNSDKTPDYKGIELKSHREKRPGVRNVLFTQTPDWDISALKSGREIVAEYGYYVDGGKKTYQSTVQCDVPNSQSLLLNLNRENSLLELKAMKSKLVDVAAWRLIKLHERLTTKHRETFWIEVENRKDDGREYFRYKQIEHTRNPNVGQFDTLLEQRIITVDLLLSRPSGHGDTYSFKIRKKGMPLLFPESEIFVI